MTESLHYFNFTLGVLAIILQLVSVFTLVLLFLVPRGNKIKDKFLSFVSKHFLFIGFFISFFAVALSLFYSEIIGYAACSLCWWQRIFFFPQVVLFGVALFKKPVRLNNSIKQGFGRSGGDRAVIYYSFPLLLAGFLIALYHNFIYYFAESLASCDVSGVSCVQRLVNEIGGYASIPMFSLTMFSALIILLLVVHFYKREHS